MHIHIHIFLHFSIIMQTTEMDTRSIGSIFQKEDTPQHSWELRRELHLPQSPSGAKHDPLGDNMSAICSTKEWPQTAFGPLARQGITFRCHSSVLPPNSRAPYAISHSQPSQSEVMMYYCTPAVTYQRHVDFEPASLSQYSWWKSLHVSVCVCVFVIGGGHGVIFWKT